ncbi:MAG TPA: hypothetical protein VHP37_14795 [Burkholderiales bacterium]|nr:hypothetical protein [Burkholderiales bacterium]
MSRPRRRREDSFKGAGTSLTLGDRLKYGAIGAGFGAVSGVGLLLVALFALALPVRPPDILGFSTVYFGVLGFLVGEFIGDLFAASIGGLLDILAFDYYAPTQRPAVFTDGRTFRPVWILIAFVGWLVASWLIYLR